MVHYQPRLDETFRALADPARRAIVARLAEGTQPVTALAAPFAMSLQAVRKHLLILEDAGLVKSEKKGRVRHCRLEAASLKDAAHWLTRRAELWSGRLDTLDQVLKGRKS